MTINSKGFKVDEKIDIYDGQLHAALISWLALHFDPDFGKYDSPYLALVSAVFDPKRNLKRDKEKDFKSWHFKNALQLKVVLSIGAYQQ